MRPHTPTINTSRAEHNVTSPPETPTTTGSHSFTRKFGSGSNDRKGTRGELRRSSIPPLGGVGSQFNYARGIRPEEISPRSSNSSDDESETSASPPQSPLSDAPAIRPGLSYVSTAHIVVEATFEIEEYSGDDEDAMDNGDDDILRPYGFEYPDSERSRSRPRSEQEVDPQLMDSLQDLKTCFRSDDESDSDMDGEYGDYMRELKILRQQRRARRMTSGSISKRTVSERGSDSDREDLQPWDTGDNNQRRLRRKVDRRSLLSIPPEIIIELKEPNSDGEYVWDEHEINLARELPFWTMEVDSD
jgi:hypothetical protein